MADQCAAPRHRENPPPPETSTYLCRPCRDRLRRDLHATPRYDTLLGTLLTPTRAAVPARWHTTGAAAPVFDAAVSACRTNLRALLTSWTQAVAAERRYPPPAASLDAMAAWLAFQAGDGVRGWIQHQPFAGDMAGEFARACGWARNLCWPRPRTHTGISGEWCPACGLLGGLTVWFAAGEPPRVECGACGAVWGPHEWTRLGRRLFAGHPQERVRLKSGGVGLRC